MPSGEEIQANLRVFVGRWCDYEGSERGEAQTFLNELFACYGSDRRELGAKFEDFVTSAGFMDLHWPGVCIVEMKAPVRPVSDARPQLERYWRESSVPAQGIQAARWVVLCNFRQVEIWEPGRFPTQAVATFDLADLPERYDSLAFLAGPSVEPNFNEHYRELTQEAAKVVAGVYQDLLDRSAGPPEEIQRFILQSVWCMFADDLQMMDGFPFQETLNAAAADPDNSAALIGFMFRVLNQRTNTNRTGRLAGTRYVNGDLFAEPAYVQLNIEEIRQLLQASAFDWRKVNPTIFGSLMEGVLGHDRRWELGAHYTHETDIMKIVGPTIVKPWRERIEAAATPEQARALLDELCLFKTLDPACGCGNFLYVAYRELRGLEHEIKQRIRYLAETTGLPLPQGDLPFYPLRNIQGIDIEPAAVAIARVTLWMGHRQMIDRYGDAEPPLPLQDLSGIRHADALRVPWPETDCIIGNPPFLGDRLLRRALGDDYVRWLRREFDGHLIDLSGYWFRRAADHLRPGQHAGFVSTNTLRENKHRRASLDYLVAKGGVITDAVSSQKWPGEARVHVSLTNWVHQPDNPVQDFTLDGVSVQQISTQLRGVDPPADGLLHPNHGRSFIGCQPTGAGFILDDEAAQALLDAAPSNGAVVRRYLTGDDIVNDPRQEPTRWIIDFGTMRLEEASRFEGPMQIVRRDVKPGREGASRHFARLWWQFAWPRPDMRQATAGLPRFIVSTLTGKRLFFSWCEPTWTPSNLTGVYAFDDDYSIGILLSRAHDAWAWAQSSTLETRLRYTPSSVFETFAWPDPVTSEQRAHVARAAADLLARRSEICSSEQIGLTKLYNDVDDGAWADLKALHLVLDRAVVDCYGWPAAEAQDADRLVRRLSDLNREIVDGRREYDPFPQAAESE